MPGPDTLEKRGNEPPYPHAAGFAKLLDWHLDFGTRPNGDPERPGPRWGNVEFADAVGTGERSVRNWRAGRVLPSELGSVEFVLFGRNQAYNAWRFDLRAAYDGQRPAAEFPRPPTDFLGRNADIAAILEVLLSSAPSCAILIQGAPGIGKTAVTKALATNEDIIERFGETNRWFVELETATTTALMQDAISRKLGAEPQSGFKATLALLRKRPGLLVLDNLETPWDPKTERRATEDTLASLAAISGVAILASFRGRERVGGPAWALVHPIDRLKSPFDSELFCRTASATFDGDPHLPLLLSALEGIPLAIELVARRAFGQASLAELWEQWTKIGSELAVHADFAVERLTSLPHSIELSLKSSRMTEAAHRLFRLLGQLPAGIVAEDRDELLGSEGFDSQDRLQRIGLALKRGNRLDLLSPIRDHARRHHIPQPPDDTGWPTHYLDLARLGETIGTVASEGVTTRLQPEFANISAAMSGVLSARPRRREKAIAALAGFSRLTYVAMLPAPVLNELAEACRVDGDLRGQADCIYSLGEIALRRYEYDAACKAFEDALALYRKVGPVLGEANCVWRLSEIAHARSDHDTARKASKDALQFYRKIGDVHGEANCVFRHGDIALARSDHDTARKAFKDALQLYRKIGDIHGEANCINSLGTIALRRYEYDTARKAFEEALQLFRKFGSVLGEALCIESHGDIALCRSDHDAARKAFEEALQLFRKCGSVLGEANCIYSLGDIALARSEHDTARKAFKDALQLYRKIGDIHGEANCIQGFGEMALVKSDHDGAREAFEEALQLYRKFGSVLGEADCIKGHGDIALARSDHDTTRKAFEDALALYRKVGAVQGEANCIKGLGDIALARSDHAAAGKAFEGALPLYRKVGAVQGEANCIKGLGDIALARSDHAAAGKAFEGALPLCRKVGDVQGETYCIQQLDQLRGKG
jgi:tetratricopeptide (TPR) repeat protein